MDLFVEFCVYLICSCSFYRIAEKAMLLFSKYILFSAFIFLLCETVNMCVWIFRVESTREKEGIETKREMKEMRGA